MLRHRLYTADSGEAPHPWRHADQMKSVLRRIRRDYAAPLTLDELAAEAGLAPKYLCRVFRQVTGRTPIDYLNYYRIECAAELLCTTTDSITDVALSCGFNDPSYFSRMFRRQKRVSRPCLQESVFRRRLNICNIGFLQNRYPLIKSAPLLYLHLLREYEEAAFVENLAYQYLLTNQESSICSRERTPPSTFRLQSLLFQLRGIHLCPPSKYRCCVFHNETTASPRAATFPLRHFRAF